MLLQGAELPPGVTISDPLPARSDELRALPGLKETVLMEKVLLKRQKPAMMKKEKELGIGETPLPSLGSAWKILLHFRSDSFQMSDSVCHFADLRAISSDDPIDSWPEDLQDWWRRMLLLRDRIFYVKALEACLRREKPSGCSCQLQASLP